MSHQESLPSPLCPFSVLSHHTFFLSLDLVPWIFQVNGVRRHASLGAASLTYYDVTKVYPCCSICQLFFSPKYFTVRICHILFVHSSTGKHLGYFYFFIITNNCYKHLCTSFCVNTILVSIEQEENCWITCCFCAELLSPQVHLPA